MVRTEIGRASVLGIEREEGRRVEWVTVSGAKNLGKEKVADIRVVSELSSAF